MYKLFRILSTLYLLSLLSCRQSSSIPYRTYEAFANDDITVSTETGEMIFIPYGGLLRYDLPYHGKVIIKLSPYKNLLDSLCKFIRLDNFYHPVQLVSPIVKCLDEQGHPLKINIRNGYQLLLFMPLKPGNTKYAGHLLHTPNDLFMMRQAFDSFGIRFNFDYLPGLPDHNTLFAMSRREPKAGTEDYRQDASLAYYKTNSVRVLQRFLHINMASEGGKFIRTLSNKDNLKKLQSDRLDYIPFLCFNILELYDSDDNTHLRQIFTRHSQEWQQSLLIIDWTGSMQIHKDAIKGLLEDMYMKNTIRHLVLYNDDDDPGDPHLNDDVGFFYIDSVESYKQVEHLMEESTNDGTGGGSAEEDDFSALIRATSRKIPPWKSDYKQIIMLVDNNAPPRHPEIFNQIQTDKKIFVIAYDVDIPCSVDSNYHKLVRKFGGLLIAEGQAAEHNCQDSTAEKCVYAHKGVPRRQYH